MRNPGRESRFRFKQFAVKDNVSAMKVGTDGVLLGAWVGVEGVCRVLDAGTGTGLIALMIAQRNSDALIDAVEIDRDAALEAKLNCGQSPWGDRITVTNTGFEDFARDGECRRWDLIVSNPPFFSTGNSSDDSRRAKARHEGGLSYDSILERASAMLVSGGRVAFISPSDREDDIICSSALHRMYPRRLTRVSTVDGKPASRLLWEFSTDDGPLAEDSLSIRTVSGGYTPGYVDLTKEFYLRALNQ